jgi:mRNA interferase MazF
MPNRGDLVTVSLPGDFGKPRPAVVIQSDLFALIPSLTVLPMTSELIDAEDIRIRIQPNPTNGLREVSDVMLDKANTVVRAKVGVAFGRLSLDEMDRIGLNLSVFLGLA